MRRFSGKGAGVGKTTLLRILEKKLLNGYALIDGDDVGRTIPLSISIDWLNLIQDNIIACAKNFKDYLNQKHYILMTMILMILKIYVIGLKEEQIIMNGC